MYTVENLNTAKSASIIKAAKNWKSGNTGIQTAIAACAYQAVTHGNPDWFTLLLKGMDQVNVNLTNMRASLGADGKRVWRYTTKGLNLPVMFDGETGTVRMMPAWQDAAPDMDTVLATLNDTLWATWDAPKAAPANFELAKMLENFLKTATSSKKGNRELSDLPALVTAAVRCQQAAAARKGKFVELWGEFAPVKTPPVTAAPAVKRTRRAHKLAAVA